MKEWHEMAVLGWRIAAVEPSGLSVYFDPSCESVRLFRIPSRDSYGLTASEMVGLADAGDPGYLDKVGSVRGLRDEGEAIVDDPDTGLLEAGSFEQLPLGFAVGDDHGQR